MFLVSYIPPLYTYDLILWDHGGGPTNGFAADEHDPNPIAPSMMSFAGILEALAATPKTGDMLGMLFAAIVLVGGMAAILGGGIRVATSRRRENE